MRFYLFFISVIGLFSCQEQSEFGQKSVLRLDSNWSFAKVGDSLFYPAKVPGQVHLDLLSNGLIGDPFWEDNELKQRWVEEEDWIYKTSVKIDNRVLSNERIELRFNGLDTYADVYLNEQKILSASNMFRSWTVDAKPFLGEGKNELKIVFHSPVEFNKAKVEGYPHKLPSGNEGSDISTKVSSFTRKAAYHFGWDWGPRFVTSGIWRDVTLTTWNHAIIRDLFTSTQSLQADTAFMRSRFQIEASREGNYSLQIGDETISLNLEKGVNIVEYDFIVEHPQLWWTHDFGEPFMYSTEVKLYSKDDVVDTYTDKYGIRTIELVNQPDSIGTAFYFVLNGNEIFMQGANYIPQDVFLSRVTDNQYRTLLHAAKEANMNMLRVWGGGIYEEDLFYDLCDSLGILVWQDFMFAGSLYPDTKEFKENVKEEITQNIKRLRTHPCLAIWCGNNEIEVAWKNWGWQKQYGYSKSDSISIWKNYESIFLDLIPSLVSEHHPEAYYTSTTPLSNWGSAQNFNHGSMHYWGVWHGREPFENFSSNVGRFMVEYGFQSYPSISSLSQVIADTNLNLNSPSMAHRQKSFVGNGLILQHIEHYFDKPETFEEFVQRSQQTQAIGLQMAIEAHKRDQTHCRGTLFWQLNDCWPGPSWSVIDYYGQKKLAYDAVKQAFQ